MDRLKNKICYLCGSDDLEDTGYALRDSDCLKVLKCKKCSLVFLSSFDHIDSDFYKDGKMHGESFDPQKWLDNSFEDDLRRFNFLKNCIKNKKILDFGCGAGGFLQMSQNIAALSIGVEKQSGLQKLFEKTDLTVYEDINQINQKFDIITMFHVLEHMKDPKSVVKELLSHLEKKGELIIEVPSEDDALLSLYKNKPFADFTHWSCHLYSFNQKTLKKIFDDMDLKINYIKPIQRYGAANHLYWIIKGKKGGHVMWKFPGDFILDFLYKNFLKLISKTDTLIISISKK